MHSATPIRAYVGLGSNAANADEMLARAQRGIKQLDDIRLGAVSQIYATQPQDYTDQPWFLNQVAELLPGASWRPLQLLEALLALEKTLGRERSQDPAKRYGPRVIDADLLLYGKEQSQNPRCLLPHPRLTLRAFVLVPLLDIAPQIRIGGIPAIRWLSRLSCKVEGNKIFQ
ncbi:MAG: 2-amino-4-hydroxy-6-hydroxymethyldihydropteridine diphosphokinase [Desulfovibrio sp.]|jgi:2-amino-4-hydroxy-6-hydroxymethyldihydropteridine diphosphokinase|nr:2-amino-4-hydroxy-6-hydroxymethyldihydropteridine diphosphokinase [Desulfovibrio sp.]